MEDINILKQIADAGSIVQTCNNVNIGTARIAFTVNGAIVTCQYSCGLGGLYAFSIEDMASLAAIAGKGVK